VRYAPAWIRREGLTPGAAALGTPPGTTAANGLVVVCGFGRVGSAIADALQAFETPESMPPHRVVTRLDEILVYEVCRDSVPGVGPPHASC
jgi:hypothetical protein